MNKSLCAAALIIVLTGCKKETASNKVRVGYIGLTCEAPIFTAIEKGFFKEEGLEVSLVKCEWANYKDILALGGLDINRPLAVEFFKPIEKRLRVKITRGSYFRRFLRPEGQKRSGT